MCRRTVLFSPHAFQRAAHLGVLGRILLLEPFEVLKLPSDGRQLRRQRQPDEVEIRLGIVEGQKKTEPRLVQLRFDVGDQSRSCFRERGERDRHIGHALELVSEGSIERRQRRLQ